MAFGARPNSFQHNASTLARKIEIKNNQVKRRNLVNVETPDKFQCTLTILDNDQFALHLVFLKSFADQVCIGWVVFHQENDVAGFRLRIPRSTFKLQGG